MHDGRLESICKVVRDLSFFGKHNRLNDSDNVILQRAQNVQNTALMRQAVAASRGLPPGQRYPLPDAGPRATTPCSRTGSRKEYPVSDRDRIIQVPIGPQHPALKEPVNFRVVADGETIVRLELEVEDRRVLADALWPCGLGEHHESVLQTPTNQDLRPGLTGSVGDLPHRRMGEAATLG
jgi:hypothetical protein